MITGLSIISSIGNNQQEVLAFLHEGRLGITFSQELKDPGMCSHVQGSIKLNTTDLIDRKVVRFMGDASIYASLSMGQAIADAGLSSEAYQNSPRVGLIAGSGGGPPCFRMFGIGAMRGPRDLKVVGPYVVTKVMVSGVSACLATPFKIHGVNYSISSACMISTHYVGNAVGQIQLDKQNIVFAGDGEELYQEMACEFDAMGVLSTKYSDTPERASRTYDVHHDGFIIAGGGGMVVVEGLEYALARDVRTCAEITDYGVISDDTDTVASSSEGAIRRARVVMHGVDTPIDYLNPHGTPTPISDMKGLAAIREVLDDRSPVIFVTKAMTGHSLDTADAQETIYSLLMLEHGFIAPNINIEGLDEQITGLNIVTGTTDHELITVIFDNSGLGGTNATLVMRKLKD